MRTPRVVGVAIALQALAFALGAAGSTAANIMARGVTPLTLTVPVVAVLFVLWLSWKTWEGRNWVRILLWVLVGSAIAFGTNDLATGAPDYPVTGHLLNLVHLVSVALLWTSAADPHFRRPRRERFPTRFRD